MGPRDAPLSAITLSFHQGNAAAAVEASILQDELMQGPNAGPVSERHGFHYFAGTKDVARAPGCCSAR